jgi:hypothetical protein
MIEEIITKKYKTRDSKIFASTEEAEKYEEVLEFLNNLKEHCKTHYDISNCKCTIDEKSLELQNCSFEDRDRSICWFIAHYDVLKKAFKVDDLKFQIKYWNSINEKQSKVIQELSKEIQDLEESNRWLQK